MKKNILKEVYRRLEEKGFKAKMVSLEHVTELKLDFDEKHRKGLFDPEFYQSELASFNFENPEQLPNATSVIVVAAPQPKSMIHIESNGKQYPIVVPPTYSYATDEQAGEILEAASAGSGYHVAKARLPFKLLAVRSGLAHYGTNNISYIDGMGSFYRLAAFYTDLPLIEDSWGEMQTMERCEKCSACIQVCPSGAITKERFLIRGERCITFHNERNVEFPGWIDPAWHNTLVGCLHCQRVCPADKDVFQRVENKGVMSGEDADRLMSGASRDELSNACIQLIEQLGLMEYYDRLGRNLKMLIREK
jgi:epoxyqueuosine reductase